MLMTIFRNSRIAENCSFNHITNNNQRNLSLN
nr:MAG TPA: hypothetical protein [Caudoviricetes sp.]